MQTESKPKWEKEFNKTFADHFDDEYSECIGPKSAVELKSFISSLLQSQAEDLAKEYSSNCDKEIKFRLAEVIESIPGHIYRSDVIDTTGISLQSFKQQLRGKYL